MKSYLSLIPISARVHKKQNRMTILCIIFSVFLVTAVFSMADVGVRMERDRLIAKHGAKSVDKIANNPAMMNLYIIAGVLFIMILVAGVLMISSSMNSNVAQRVRFFGMMRCIGMGRDQIMRFVRLEALNWCKTAIPIGLVSGTAATWILCLSLKYFVGGEFADISVFSISIPGISSGIIMALVTVLIAAGAPARKASKISPVTAVSGNCEIGENTARAAKSRFFKIETALGINHAFSSKKNLFLIAGSFALSIVLFLSFSVLTDFVGYIMPQLSNTPDISISAPENSIDEKYISQLEKIDGVKNVYGRRSLLNQTVKIENPQKSEQKADLISFDRFDLKSLEKDKVTKRGDGISKVVEKEGYVAVPDNSKYGFKVGDKLSINGKPLEIAALLKYDPFSSDGNSHGNITIISSGKTFKKITGIDDYSLIMIQTDEKISESSIEKIKKETDRFSFKDMRDQNTSATYTAFMMFVYGFLAIIAMVTVLNIVNSISMSVSARTRQYGAMRAVGMDEKQITKMIASEAAVYALSGCIAGCAIGLIISRKLYSVLITSHFGYAVWSAPLLSLSIIVAFVILSTFAAVYSPSKRIRKSSVTETISEL